MLILILELSDYMNNFLKSSLEFFKGIGTIFLYLFLALIASFLLENTNIYISNIGTYLIILIPLFLIYQKRLISDFKSFQKDYFNTALKNWLIGLSIMIISNLIITVFFNNGLSTNETANRQTLLNNPLISIIIMVFIAPLTEEITFRASFKNAFQKWYTFAIVTGFIFGFMHVENALFAGNIKELLFIIPYGALGFFFAKAYYETDNIYTSYIAHMMHNALCILLIILF